jgi:hypothetical protein
LIGPTLAAGPVFGNKGPDQSCGEPHFSRSQVAPSDLITVFAFAPIVGLPLDLSSIT